MVLKNCEYGIFWHKSGALKPRTTTSVTENDNLSSENNGLIDDLRAQADYLEHIEKSLTYQTEELAIEKTDLEADNKGLADQNGELTAQIADLEADKKGLFDLVEDIMTQCDKLDATIQSLQARNGGLVKENRDLKAIREKLQEEVKASKSREVANAKAKTQHAGDIKRLEEEVSRLNSRLKDDQIRHGQEILDKSEENGKLDKKLQAAKSQDRKKNPGKGSKGIPRSGSGPDRGSQQVPGARECRAEDENLLRGKAC